MADAYICRRGGAGGAGGADGSEFVIVGGTTSPAKAAQNTVWVDTPAEITGYDLSATEPVNPVAGMLWLIIGNGGGVKLTIPLGDDWLTMYLLSAKQYIGGTWVDKEAQIYLDGEWHALFSREFYISDGEMLVEPTSTYQAKIEELGGVCRISTDRASFQWAVNFECNNHAGQTVYIEIESGYALNAAGYTSGVLVNTVEADATDSTPDYVAQTLISSTETNTVYELKIPADFHSGYLTIHVEPNVNNGYYDIKNLWIE